MTQHLESNRPRLLLALVCVAQFMLVADLAVVNVALPTIRDTFAASQAQLQWVSSIYALCFGGFLLVGGRAADLVGHRRMLTVGLTVFAGASLACGLANDATVLIAGRAFQGLAAGFAAPAALAVITSTFVDPPARRRAVAAYSTTGVLGGAIGFIVGGIATATTGWESAFLAQVPVCAALILAHRRLLPAEPRRSGRGQVNASAAAVVTLASLGAIYGLTQITERGWFSVHSAGALGLSVVLAALGLALDGRAGERLLPPAVTSHPMVRSANALSIVLGATAAPFFFITQYIQDNLDHGPFTASVLLSVIPASIIVGIRATRSVRDRFPDRLAISTGLTLLTVGLLLLSRAPRDGVFLDDVLPGALLFGFGRGLAMPLVTARAVSSVRPEHAGAASGLLNTTSQLGTAFGLGTLATVADGTNVVYPTAGSEGFGSVFLAAAFIAFIGVVLSARPAQRYGRRTAHV